MQAMGLFDFLDGIPDDYVPKQRMTAEETEEAFTYLKNHPLFIDHIPEDIENYPELLALQNLQYDDTPVNIAAALLKNANEIMKKDGDKKYFQKKAYEVYSDAIEQDCGDKELMAKLFSNRALISYKQKNYKCAIQDCKWAIENDPKFIKPYFRCAQCLYQILHFTEALKFCNLALEISKEKDIEELKKLILQQIEKQEKKTEEEKKLQQIYAICNQKGIRMGPSKISLPPEYQPQKISLEQANPPILTVPMLVTYPEFKQRDFIQYCSEQTKLYQILAPLFQTPLPWDQDQQYNLNNIECYIELDDGNYAKLNIKAKMLSIMQGYKVTVREFIEILLVCPGTNYYKKQFRSEYHILNDQ
ncbi:unnamed protein product [Paramecium octaurelia]|uniref:Cns1/TTC4 wheel domain-containing protein n=1 Tax=Paramecium octaurelia TaxID=43137 RepID=A0A8S1X3H8_PAROT|nr:unnamed protein product [Paramecium octaurelia]